ncbi:hypothetical protein [Microbispora sp. H10670]|uniref:hypothetical protein n=1 Tax=Microbispora sp. H10670 TaxID=2729108 RepID=UPI0016043C2A|nr:hypothetical protein [Microbispora sp. H10670]
MSSSFLSVTLAQSRATRCGELTGLQRSYVSSVSLIALTPRLAADADPLVTVVVFFMTLVSGDMVTVV